MTSFSGLVGIGLVLLLGGMLVVQLLLPVAVIAAIGIVTGNAP